MLYERRKKLERPEALTVTESLISFVASRAVLGVGIALDTAGKQCPTTKALWPTISTPVTVSE
jgi:hypothetical protein